MRRLAILAAVLVFALVFFALLVSACAKPVATDPQATGPEPQPPVTPEEPNEPEPPKGEPDATLPGNTFLFTRADDFCGEHDSTETTAVGNGAIAVVSKAGQGTYTSPVYRTAPFEYMILSWNADTPKGSYVEIQGRVYAQSPNGPKWSEWLSWGNWSSTAFIDQERRPAMAGSAIRAKADDPVARVATDELYVKGTMGETADLFQYRLILHKAGEQASEPSPKVTLVACTIRNSLKDQSIPVVIPDNAPDLAKLEKDLNVPTYSQQTRYMKIASSICSPTSVAMALGYHGVDISPDETAWGVNDYVGDMFGNWAFNVAYAATHGMQAYVAYGVVAPDVDPWYPVKTEIVNGNPVVVSVKYRTPGYKGRTEPEVEGVPINYTAGHLVLVRGFTWRDGREYVIVNDSAAGTNDEVRRMYPADQFYKAWISKVMYVIRPDEGEIAEPVLQPTIMAELVRVGEVTGGSQSSQRFELMVDGQPMDASTKTLRSGVFSYNGQKTEPYSPREGAMAESNYVYFPAMSPPGRYTFWFFDMQKNTYKAEIDW